MASLWESILRHALFNDNDDDDYNHYDEDYSNGNYEDDDDDDDDEPAVHFQRGRNCEGGEMIRIWLRKVHIPRPEMADQLSNLLVEEMIRLSPSSFSSSHNTRSSCASTKESSSTTMHDSPCDHAGGRRILELEACPLVTEAGFMSTFLRNVVLKHPGFFDVLDISGETVEDRSYRLARMAMERSKYEPNGGDLFSWDSFGSLEPSMGLAIRDILRRSTRLHSMSLTSLIFCSSSAKAIFPQGLKTTRRNANLKVLKLRGSSFDNPYNPSTVHELLSSPTAYLAQGLWENKSLQVLDLSMIGWTDVELAIVLRSIIGHPKLKILDLEGSQMGPESLQALQLVLEHPQCKIRCLDLSKLNIISDDEDDDDEEANHENRSLKHLDKTALLNVLDVNHSLERIRLEQQHNEQYVTNNPARPHPSPWCTYQDLVHITRLIRRHPRLIAVSHDDLFLPDGTAGMETIGLRSTIRVLLEQHKTCRPFLIEAIHANTPPTIWAECLARINRIAHDHSCQDAQHEQRTETAAAASASAVYPFVQAMAGLPGVMQASLPPPLPRLREEYDCDDDKNKANKNKRKVLVTPKMRSTKAASSKRSKAMETPPPPPKQPPQNRRRSHRSAILEVAEHVAVRYSTRLREQKRQRRGV